MDEQPAPLIGRHRELNALTERLKGARGGSAGLVLVRGAPGVGKSRLLAEAVEQARRLGFRVLSGRADELDRGVAYAALRDALAPALAAEDNPLLAALVAEVGRSMSSGGAEPGGDDAPSSAIEQLLRAWSDRDAVLLAIDDLHAADDDTLAVVSLLARTLRDTRVLLAATLRSDPPDLRVELAAMVERLGGRPGVEVIDVGPLDADDVVALASTRLGAAPDDELTGQLVDLTRGNPFYVEEVLRAYRAAGAIDLDGGRARLAPNAQAPTLTRRSAVLHRIFSLGRDERAVARALTALQRISVDRLDLVATIAGLDRDGAGRAFDTLVRARVLVAVGDGGFEFAHPIVRATLDEDLGPDERRRLHREVAARLVDADVLELATHVAHSAAPGDVEAAAVLARAGDATAGRAPRSAAEWYRRALDLLPVDDPSRAGVTGRLARALFFAQRKAEAAELGRAAVEALPPGLERERVALVLAASLRALGRMDEALTVTESLPARDETGALGLLAERARLLVHLDRFDEADEAAATGLARATDARTRALACAAAAQSAFARGDVPRALRLVDDAARDVERLPAPTEMSVRLSRASHLAYAGWADDALEALADLEARGAALGVEFRTSIDPPTVWALGLAGRWDDALERAHLARLEFERSGELFLLSLLRTMEAAVLLERGAVRDAADVLATVTDAPSARSAAAWVRAGIAAAFGRLEEARQGLVAAIELDERTGRGTVVPLLIARRIDVELLDGQAPVAASLLDELDRHAAHVGSPWTRCLSARARALVERDAALARDAVAEARGVGLRFEAAVSELAVADLDAAAVDELRHAHDELRAMGAEPWRRRAAQLLRARGLAVPRGRTRADRGLSETERQLARLVTEGMTNREIANALFLSPKTVEVYLSRLYAKAGCSSRVELAVAVKAGALILDA